MTALPERELRRFTPDEYLRLEEESEEPCEFIDGFIYVRAMASDEHALLGATVSRIVGNALAGSDCRIYDSSLLVRGSTDAFYAHPDATVICGPLQHEPGRNAVVNPTVVFEILSPSTHRYDRGEKLDRYLEIASLEEYVLVWQDRPKVEVHSRVRESDTPRPGVTGVADAWVVRTTASLGASFDIPSISASIPLEALYAGVEFPD